MRDSKRNVLLLALCQALLMSSSSLIVTTAALVGVVLAPSPMLSTAPIGLMFLAVMCTSLPASLFMRRVGRRIGLTCGASVGVLGASLAYAGITNSSFALFCLGMAFIGVFNSFGQYYRFAAADAAEPRYRSRAISLVMAGGVVAAFIGPNLARVSVDMASMRYAGGYVVVGIIACLCVLVVSRVSIPPPTVQERTAAGRSMREIARSPVFLVAAFGGMIAYGSMNLIMTSTPLAMHFYGHPFGSTAMVIQWHVFGMFAPAFVTGRLIQRFGTLTIMGLGAAMLSGCALVNLGGAGVAHFWTALVLLGVGWNFLFVGATTLLTEAYAPAEKAKVQGVNDLLVFSMVALSATSSGALLEQLGWVGLNLAVLPGLLLILMACLWLRHHRRRAAAVAA